MGNRILIVIDVQNDFVSGSLGTKEAQKMLPALIRKVNDFNGSIIFTQDSHPEEYLKTQEGRFLPVEHCITDTDGWKLVEELEKIRLKNNFPSYKKESFGSLQLAEDIKKQHEEEALESIELVGLCTDICVVSNALILKAALPEVPIIVDASCCAGVTVQKHLAALEVMKSCQIIVKGE